MKDVVKYDLDKINKVIEILDTELSVKGLGNIQAVADMYKIIKEDGTIVTEDDSVPEMAPSVEEKSEELARELFNAQTDTLPEAAETTDEAEKVACEVVEN